jgi:hypothetical protein
LLASAAASCAQVKIMDAQVCADIGSQGATCDNFLTSKPVDIPQPEWDDRRFGQLCISGSAFADIKREIEQLCSANAARCDYETEQAMHDFFTRMDKLR